MTRRYGATPQEWNLFSIGCELTADLLPVVSDPKAPISPKSKMQRVGKTPSIYNRDGHVVGFLKWTTHVATDADIAKWSADPAIGICLQTRVVRALDIDVPDRETANKIRLAFEDVLGVGPLPFRYREDSGKLAVAFRVGGEMSKRVMKVDGGIVELLATGQQFLVAGTHQDGKRYQWNWRELTDFPAVSREQLDIAWGSIVAQFATGEVRDGGGLRNPPSGGKAKPDSTLDFLEEHALVSSYGGEGQAFIPCPFEDEHTTDTGESATCYFPAGTRGYAEGRFVCLHGHCIGRGQFDFEQRLGIVGERMKALAAHVEKSEITPALKQDNIKRIDFDELPLQLVPGKGPNVGKIVANLPNLYTVFSEPRACGRYIRLDTFVDDLVWAPLDQPKGWRLYMDDDTTKFRLELEQNRFMPLTNKAVKEAISLVAREHAFDTAVEWLRGLPEWDGVPRVKTFMCDYCGAADTAYATAVGHYIWTALAGRCVLPGIKADMVPVFVGIRQGERKSSFIEAMLPSHEMFADVNLQIKDADLARLMRGKLIGELAELQGLQTRDAESIKAFITRRFDKWIPKYKEGQTNYGRRGIFIGTTNHAEFLVDTTGNRRWLPIETPHLDPVKMARDRNQLWAEGLWWYEQGDIRWADAERLAGDVHNDHRIVDEWEEMLRKWLYETDAINGGCPADRPFITRAEAFSAVGKSISEVEPRDGKRLGSAMRALNYRMGKAPRGLVEGEPPKVWLKIAGGA